MNLKRLFLRGVFVFVSIFVFICIESLVFDVTNIYASSVRFDDILYQYLTTEGMSDKDIFSLYEKYKNKNLENEDIKSQLYAEISSYVPISELHIDKVGTDDNESTSSSDGNGNSDNDNDNDNYSDNSDHLGDYSREYVYIVKLIEKIYSIDTDIVFKELSSGIQKEIRLFLGSNFEEESITKIKDKIRAYLKMRGYYRVHISLNLVRDYNKIYLNFKIDPEYPCTISSISRKPELPFGMYYKVSKGDICDYKYILEDINSIRLKLKDRGYFKEDISDPILDYDEEKNTATLTINGSVGKKVGVDITVKGEQFVLLDWFKKDPQDVDLSSADAANIKEELKEGYRSLGYEDVVVSSPVTVEESNSITYKYNIDLNTRYRFYELEVHGNNFFSSEQVEDIVGLKKWYNSYYDNLQLKQGIEFLKTEYRKNGFWNIKITEPRIIRDSTLKTIKVVLFIEEGIRRVFAGLSINGNQNISKEEIMSLCDIKIYDGVDYLQLKSVESILKEKYRSQGYLHPNIKLEWYTSSPNEDIYELSVVLNIKEGSRVKIANVKIIGNNRVRSKVIERELRFSSGDWLDLEKIDITRRSIISLGLFSKVNISYSEPYTLKNEEVIDIEIQVVEGSEGSVSFGPGWSLYKGWRFSVEGSYNNFTGLARRIFARVQLSEEWKQTAIDSSTILGRTISVGYTEPYLKGLPISTTVSFTDRTTADETRLYSKMFDLYLYHKFRWTYNNSGIGFIYRNNRSTEESAEEQKVAYLRYIGGNYTISSIGLVFNWDNRNDIAWPNSGGNFNAEYSIARNFLEGNVAYNFYKVSYTHYFKMLKNFVFTSGFNVFNYYNIHRKFEGYVQSFLPVSQAVHVGGTDSVRGFKERSLGPYIKYNNSEGKEEYVNLGGSSGAIFRLELKYKWSSWNMASSLFLDIGNTFYTDKEIKDFYNKIEDKDTQILDNVHYELSDIFSNPEYLWTKNYKSVGLSLGYITPLGTINVAYGIPLNVNIPKYAENVDRANKDSNFILRGRAHISIGSSF